MRAETAMLVPIEYLECLSGGQVFVCGNVVVRSPQAYHYPFFGFCDGLSRSKCPHLLTVGREYVVYIASAFRCQGGDLC